MTYLTIYLIIAIFTFGYMLKLLSTLKYKDAYRKEFKDKKSLPYILSLVVGITWPVILLFYIRGLYRIIVSIFQKIKNEVN